MGIYVTSGDWTERVRWVRRLVSSRSDLQPSSDRSSRQRFDAAEGGVGNHPNGTRRATHTISNQGEIRRHQLAVLGLDETATVEDITLAHYRLVSDLTPGQDADHSRVELALAMLEEVDQAFRWLKMSAVA